MRRGMVNSQVVTIFNGIFEPQKSSKNAKSFAKRRRRIFWRCGVTILALTMTPPTRNERRAKSLTGKFLSPEIACDSCLERITGDECGLKKRASSMRRARNAIQRRTDAEWALIEPFIPPAERGGRPRRTNMREVMTRCATFCAPAANGGGFPKIFRRVRRSTAISGMVAVRCA